jgi:hypothetical protein
MYVLFNKDNKFIGYSPDISPQANILKKEIPSSQQDLNVWKWVGDYHTGKMVSIFEENFNQEELEEEKKAFANINEKYPIGVQLANIIRQIKKIADSLPISTQDDRFMDMAEIILNTLDKHDKRIKYALTRKK